MPRVTGETPESTIRAPRLPIERLTSAVDVVAAVRDQQRALARAGLPEQWATPGLLYEDQYLRIDRDAVRFPGGSLGTYVRLEVNGGIPGVAILPVFEQRIALVRHFRYATAAWHLEIPRGFGERGLPASGVARRELAEELGCEVEALESLGTVHVDTGLSSHLIELFYATIGRPRVVDGPEPIAEVVLVTVDELKALIASAELTDSFSLAAYARASAMSLLA